MGVGGGRQDVEAHSLDPQSAIGTYYIRIPLQGGRAGRGRVVWRGQAAGAGATGAGLGDTTAGVESGEGPAGLYKLAVVVRLGRVWVGGWMGVGVGVGGLTGKVVVDVCVEKGQA